MKDEDFAYEQLRQKRIDNMKIKPKWGGKIATTLPEDQWIQRTINYDPYPHTPWAHWGPQPLSRGQKTLWVVLMIAAVALAIFGEVTK